MSLDVPSECIQLSKIETHGATKEAGSRPKHETNEQNCQKSPVLTRHCELLGNCNDKSKKNVYEPPVETVTQDERHPGWESVRKRLGTLVAVKTVMDTQKRPKARKPVGQKDFLEKFSTREYNAALRNPKKHSINSASCRISTNQKRKTSTVLCDSQSLKNNCEQQSIQDVKLKDTIVVDHLTTKEGKNVKRFNFGFSDFMYTFLEPYSNVIYYWLYIVNLAITYNSWIIFLRIAFVNAQTQFLTFWFLFDYIADFIYILDIVISCRTSFLENGIYVDDLKRMARAYLRSYQFVLDVASIIPLDLLYFLIGTTPILRLPRMLKYYKTVDSQKIILALTTYPNVQRTVTFLHLMLIMIHWNACGYFIISKLEGFGVNGWVYPKFNERSLQYEYAYCYYWSTLSLTTIGGSPHPETSIECLYMIVCYVIGIFIFASIVGQAGNVIQNMNASRIEFEHQRDSSIQYMKRHHVPEDMQRRVRLWYDYSYSRGRFQGGDINDMRLLPNKMKTELALHVHLETLRRVTFLQKCQPEFLHDLVLKMKMIIYTPGDYVCRKGEIAREMYVISDGILEVLSEAGRVLKELHSGDFFGEIGILSLSKDQNRRTADVRAFGYVELFVLSKEDVLNATKEYPLAQKILARYGRSRLKQDDNRKDGTRTDTTTTDSDEERDSMLLNVNGSQHLNANELKSSSDSRSSSFRRSFSQMCNEKRHSSKIKIPTEQDLNDARMLPNSDSRAQSSSFLQGTMMSVINPVVNPISSFVIGVKSPAVSDRRESQSCSSVLVNTNALLTETEGMQRPSICDQTKKSKCAKEADRIIDFIEASQKELVDNILRIFKAKMEKYQKRILEKIDTLEDATMERMREIDELREYILSKEDDVSMDYDDDLLTMEVPGSQHGVIQGEEDVNGREEENVSSSIPEICCE